MTPLSKTLEKAVATAIFDPGATEGYKGDRTLTEWQTQAVIRAISAYLSTQVDGLEVVAFRHPDADWAHVQYSEIASHCQKDGPQPVALVDLPQASALISSLQQANEAQREQIERLTKERDEYRDDYHGERKARFAAQGEAIERRQLVESLEARLKQAEDVIRPFAKAVDLYPEAQFADNYIPAGRDAIPSLRSFRAARTFLENSNGQ